MSQLNTASSGNQFVAVSSTSGYWTNLPTPSFSGSSTGLISFAYSAYLGSNGVITSQGGSDPAFKSLLFANGDSITPLNVQWWFLCLSNDIDYSVGDQVKFNDVLNYESGNHAIECDNSSQVGMVWEWPETFSSPQWFFKTAAHNIGAGGSPTNLNLNNWLVVASGLCQANSLGCGSNVTQFFNNMEWYLDGLSRLESTNQYVGLNFGTKYTPSVQLGFQYLSTATNYSIRSYDQPECIGSTIVMQNISGYPVTLLTNVATLPEYGFVPNVATGSATHTNWTISLQFNGTNWVGVGFTSP
jgi:hypothetical protein